MCPFGGWRWIQTQKSAVMALRTPSEDGLQSMLKKVELCNIQAMQFIAANKFSAAEALLHRALNDSRNWGRLPSRKRSSSSAGQRKKKSRLANSKNPSQSMVIRLQGLELRAATFNNLALLYRTQKKLRPALMNAMKVCFLNRLFRNGCLTVSDIET